MVLHSLSSCQLDFVEVLFKDWESQEGLLDILSILMPSPLNPSSIMKINGPNWGHVKEKIMICGIHPLLQTITPPQVSNGPVSILLFCIKFVISIWTWCPGSSQLYWHNKSIDDLESLTSESCFMSFHFDRNFSLMLSPMAHKWSMFCLRFHIGIGCFFSISVGWLLTSCRFSGSLLSTTFHELFFEFCSMPTRCLLSASNPEHIYRPMWTVSLQTQGMTFYIGSTDACTR